MILGVGGGGYWEYKARIRYLSDDIIGVVNDNQLNAASGLLVRSFSHAMKLTHVISM